MSRRDDLRQLAQQSRTRADTAAPEPTKPQQTAPEPTPAPAPAAADSAARLDTAAAARPAAPVLARPPRHANGAATTKVTLSVPPDTAAALRSWANRTRRTLGDGLLTALIDNLPAVQARCSPEATRIELGLPPLALTAAGERTHLTVRLPNAGLAELDNAAAGLAISRSDLAAALIAETRGPSRT